MYKKLSEDDYFTEQRFIKNEYKSGVMDPAREVARIEKHKIKKRNP